MNYLCTSIEPESRDVICQRPNGHEGYHKASVPTEEGILVVEWHSLLVIRRKVHKLEQLSEEEAAA